MNKGDLIAETSEVVGVSRRIASEVIDATLDAIVRAVARGDKVTLSGFGAFEKRLRAPRTARNPQTGEAVKVPATSVALFRPGQEFKESVAGRRRGRARRKR
jgi:DNA-binding protein HU-beta